MYGISIGDIAGSPYEFGPKPAEGFPLFDGTKKHMYTDDSVLTAAVCDAILKTKDLENETELRSRVRMSLQQFTIDDPFRGYGSRFYTWVDRFEFMPYDSYGNGAAMRISPVAWVGKTAEEVFTLSDLCTGVTHNHPEGLKGARAVALAVFLARHCPRGNRDQDRENKDRIRKSIEQRFYRLDFTMEELKASYAPSVTCMGTVPQAIAAFLESDSFESAIRNAISIGGDTDTLAAMAGAIAEAYYGVPEELKQKALSFLSPKLIRVFDAFENCYQRSL